MFERSPWKALLLAGFGLALTGCTNNLVDSIVITPSTQSLAVGQTVQFTAIAYQSHGTHPSTNTNVTNQATWVSSAPSIVTVTATGLATAVSAGTATIGASMQGFGGLVGSTAVVTVTASGKTSTEPVASLAIDPVSQTAFAVNQTVNFIAIGTTGSGATVDLTGQSAIVGTATIKAATWTTSNPGIASINPNTGIATALSAGSTTISAQAFNPDGTVVLGTATLTVTLPTASAEPLVSMAIIPGTQTLTSLNQPAQFIAIGTTGSGSTLNLTNKVVWTSSSPTVASINANTGLATALANGTTGITAVATNPDGTVVTGIGTVTVNIAATGEPIVSLAIVPGTQTASVVNQTSQFVAIGTTASGSTVNLTNQSATVNGATINAAVWGSSSSAVATISPATGLATAVSAGTVAITAQAKNPDGTVVTGTATFTVISTPEPLVSLAIVPAAQTLVTSGQAANFVAIGTTASGATVNLTNTSATIGGATINAATWSSSSPSVAAINPATGVATAGSSGNAVITAIASNPDGTAVTATATLTVNISATQEPLVSLTIVPGTQTTSVVGQTAQFIAIGTTSSGATVDLTNQAATVNGVNINAAVWGSSSSAVATVNPATGLATTVGSGTVAITAQARNPDGTVVTGTATFTVISTPEPLVSLAIVPAAQTLAGVGQTSQFVAIGTTSSGATVNLTNVKATIGTATINAATWGSSNSAVATINPATGLATAVTSGTTVITAIAINPDGTAVTGTATLTANISATPEPLVSLAIVPTTQTASVGQTAQYIAIGTTSSGTTVNLTNQSATVGTATINAAVWGSSSGAIATVNAATGLATAVSSGTVAITAQAKNPDGTVVSGAATFTVTTAPEPLVSLSIVPVAQTLVSTGETTQYIAIGTTATGATVNLTNAKATIGAATINAATWGSSTVSVATINPATGLAAAASSGVTVITAIAFNPDGTAVTGTATLTVNISATQEPLVSLAIVPNAQTASVVGQTAQYIAIGTTSSGTTVNLTNQAATVGTATINAAVWGSSSNPIATVNPATGITTAVSSGTVAITAQAKNPDGTVVTGIATFTVISTPEPLVSLAIVPATQTLTAAGQPAQFIAIGTTASGATVNLTNVKATIGTATINAAIWGSSTMPVATIDPATGLATAGTSGTTVITAIANNPDGTAVTGTATLTVNITSSPEPLVSLAIVPVAQTASVVGQTAQFIAIATTSSGTTVNLTNQTATIGASTVAAATWGSSSAPVATINPATGLATAISTGAVAITAQAKNPDGTVVTGTATFTVQITPEPMVSMGVIPASQTLTVLGQTANLQAVAETGTSTTVNLTNQSATIGTATILPAVWASSVPGVATVNSGTGVVTAVNQGITVVTATASNPDGSVVTGYSVITVTATGGTGGTIATITVIPNAQAVQAPNATAQFIAIGTTTTGATVNLTNSVVWSSSSAQVGTIGAVTGLATGTGQGTATITALYTPGGGGNVVNGTATFSVEGGTTEEFTAVTLIPNTQSLSEGQSSQFIALGTLGTSGQEVDVTNSPQITWSSSVGSGLGAIATVSPIGLVTGKSAGGAIITAELNNPDGTVVSANSSVTVSATTVPEQLLSLTIVPNALTVGNLQDTGNFLAIGTFSVVPYVRDLTNDPGTTWISSFPESFPVNTNSGGNAGASAGTVTAYGTGSATIIAEATSVDGTIQTAQATFSCPLVLPNPPLTPGSCYPGSQASGLLVTLTSYNEGVNNTNWLISAPSVTNTPDVLHCGPGWTGAGGSVCTATYPLNTTVVLTATQTGGGTGTFGGWSGNCIPSDASGNALPGPIFYTAAGPNYCAITLGNVAVPTSNVTIGAIFN